MERCSTYKPGCAFRPKCRRKPWFRLRPRSCRTCLSRLNLPNCCQQMPQPQRLSLARLRYLRPPWLQRSSRQRWHFASLRLRRLFARAQTKICPRDRLAFECLPQHLRKARPRTPAPQKTPVPTKRTPRIQGSCAFACLLVLWVELACASFCAAFLLYLSIFQIKIIVQKDIRRKLHT